MRIFRKSFVLCLLLGLGCLVASPATALAQDLEGHYRHGSWIDTTSGHEGPLKAHFRQIDNCRYRAVFTGRFFKVIPFRFATTLNVVSHEGDKVIFAGESRVGLFGRFSYQAVGDGKNFHADYSSRQWKGEFNLDR